MPSALLDVLARGGVERGDPVALAVEAGVGLGASAGRRGSWSIPAAEPWREVADVEAALRPRWVVWSVDTALRLAAAGVRVATAWDLAAVHRLLAGGWRADAAVVWAAAHGLPSERIPTSAPADLFSGPDGDGQDGENPLRSDGYLRADWAAGAWRRSPERLRRWAGLAEEVAAAQTRQLAAVSHAPLAMATARSESASELLCAEMAVDGLPLDRATAETIVAGFVGPRPGDPEQAAALRAGRDAAVLGHLPAGVQVDLRSSAQVKALLGRLGVEVADTRASTLRAVQGRHPVVGALLAWRKAERVGTTYGYGWLDQHLGGDGRLRGAWSSSDGAAGRMTATAGLHSLPAELRPAVRAEPGHLFVRADLGQVEPRVLAVVSGDAAMAAAARGDDLYAPVAAQLGVDRATAKVAVLGAMYGQTTGRGAQALSRLERAYPIAIAYLDAAARRAEAGQHLRTYGGRLVRMAAGAPPEARQAVAARGRYGRNAVIQGAAAELFKMWAVTLRARAAPLDARIVLCLHDELLIHVPEEHAEEVAGLVGHGLDEAVHRWAPGTAVRFVADIAVIRSWSDAKAEPSPQLTTPQ